MKRTVYIYTKEITNRLTYTCNVIFKRVLACEYKIIREIPSTIEDHSILINYSDQETSRGIRIMPFGLLEQNKVEKQDIKHGNYLGTPTIFHSAEGDIPFDLFSAVFYMLSRYEEYLPFSGDEHGRFPATESIAFKNDFHTVPIVELWIKQLAEALGYPFEPKHQQALVTIDIDAAYQYKHKGLVKIVGGLVKAFVMFDLPEIAERIKVLLGTKSDAFDTYQYLREIENKTNSLILYFLLMSNKNKLDTAFPIENKAFIELIRGLAAQSDLGLHPSYRSNTSYLLKEKEQDALEKLSKKKIDRSRQHFLKLRFPDTYKELMFTGIMHDYSMGWHDRIGFRAGISRSFPFYDIYKEQETEFMIYPFMAMDRTLKDYMKLTPEIAQQEITTLKKQVDEVGGRFIMIWHNESVSNEGEWKGWREVFEHAYLN